MPPPVPSRQVLRYLTRLCRPANTTTATITTKSPVHAQAQAQAQTLYLSTSLPQHYNPQPKPQYRSLTTTTPLRIQPTPSKDPDPQNEAQNPTLPDITNYYTLFPSTLPSGPPIPPPKTQEADSSISSESATQTPPFNINTTTLRKEFLQLQSQHHPDKFPTGTTSHQKSLALSSLINEAYKTLSDPLLRAQYLLQHLYDIDVMSEDNSAHPTDQETLMEVMESQERIEEAETREEVDLLVEENQKRIRETEVKVGEAFEMGDSEKAKEETVRLKYWKSLHGALRDWEAGKEVRLIH